jgi:succinate-acetate transporter protein
MSFKTTLTDPIEDFPGGPVAAYATAFVLVVAVVALMALFFQAIIWNVGLVGLAAAVGLVVGKISFWTALAGLFTIRFIRGVLGTAPPLKFGSDKS